MKTVPCEFCNRFFDLDVEGVQCPEANMCGDCCTVQKDECEEVVERTIVDALIDDAIDYVEQRTIDFSKRCSSFIEKLEKLRANKSADFADGMTTECQELLGDDAWYMMQDLAEKIERSKNELSESDNQA